MPDTRFNIDVEKAAADFNNAIKEAAYIAVGLGVLGFQRAQVQRVELTKQLEAQRSSLSSLTERLNGQADAYIEAAQKQVAGWRDQLSRATADLMPSEPVDTAAVRSQLTELAKAVDDAVAPVRQQFDEQLDRLEEVLPQTARELVQTVRGAAAAQEQAVRGAVGLP